MIQMEADRGETARKGEKELERRRNEVRRGGERGYEAESGWQRRAKNAKAILERTESRGADLLTSHRCSDREEESFRQNTQDEHHSRA